MKKHRIILELSAEDLQSLVHLLDANTSPMTEPLVKYIHSQAVNQMSVQNGIEALPTTCGYVRGCLLAFPNHVPVRINGRPVNFTVEQDGSITLHA